MFWLTGCWLSMSSGSHNMLMLVSILEHVLHDFGAENLREEIVFFSHHYKHLKVSLNHPVFPALPPLNLNTDSIMRK